MRTAALLHAARVAAEHAAEYGTPPTRLTDPHVAEHALMLAQYAESLHALALLNDGPIDEPDPDEDQDDEPEFVEPPEVTHVTTWGAKVAAGGEAASGITLAAHRAVLGIDQIKIVQHALEEYVRPGIRRPKPVGIVQAATAMLAYFDETFGLA